MSTYFLDASGLCKRYFANENGTELVNELFNDVTSTRYLLNLSILEILNAIYRVHREGYLSEIERDVLIAAFYQDIADGSLLVYSVYDHHIFSAETIFPALQRMSVIKKRPGPIDALFVSCARDFDLSDLILVSADVDLNVLARQYGLITFDPETPFSSLSEGLR